MVQQKIGAEQDRIAKQKLVLQTLVSHAKKDSPFEDIRRMAEVIENDGFSSLSIKILSGGYTNYTYLISTNNRVKLFAKLCFPRALWNPNPDYVYDTARLANEKEMMYRFGQMAPDCVATPYILVDLESDMKLLFAQWAPANEQLANQFIDGIADSRVAKKLGSAIASLHSSEIDPGFNTEARECMIDLFPRMRDGLVSLATHQQSVCDGNNRLAQFVRGLGPELCIQMFDNAINDYRSKRIPIHADLHAFNCLVESKPGEDREDGEAVFGEKGSIYAVDWEMAMCGPLGPDTGRVFSVPVAAIVAHSIDGNDQVVRGLMEWMDIYWQSYAEAMAVTKDEEFLKESYRNSLGWMGWLLYGMSINGWFAPFMPIEDKDRDLCKYNESLALLGVKSMLWGFCGVDSHLSLENSVPASRRWLKLKFHLSWQNAVTLQAEEDDPLIFVNMRDVPVIHSLTHLLSANLSSWTLLMEKCTEIWSTRCHSFSRVKRE